MQCVKDQQQSSSCVYQHDPDFATDYCFWRAPIQGYCKTKKIHVVTMSSSLFFNAIPRMIYDDHTIQLECNPNSVLWWSHTSSSSSLQLDLPNKTIDNKEMMKFMWERILYLVEVYKMYEYQQHDNGIIKFL